MRCLFFVVFVYAVQCEDGNYYVIQVPRNEPARSLKVYWNVPTMQCKSKKVPFEDLYQKYGIHQNEGDSFRGEQVTIMYDPGLFPALLKNETSGKFKFRNGGVPQEGNLDKHLEAFRKDLDLSIPDQGFNGIGIIDFESWRPIYRQNFGVLTPYKDVSYEIERKLHWWWHKSSLEAEAKRRFESSARTFMEETISLARRLRPGGVWGYYGFPYCFNMASNNMVEGCANKVPEENDRLSWLWRSSTALYPSVYSSASLSTSQLAALIRGRVREARRVKRGIVLPYFWYRYRDGGFLTQTDLNAALNELYKSNASGFIIWGSSSDVNTVDKCKKLYNYIDKVFGPAVARYTKKSLRDEIIDENNNTTMDNNYMDANNNATIDINNKTTGEDQDISDVIKIVNKLNSTDALNSTYDIKKEVEEEITKRFTNYVPINEDNTSEEEENDLKDNNVLVDLIINSLLNKEFKSINYSQNEDTVEHNLIKSAIESSPNTKNNVENNTSIDDNDYFNEANQSTMNKSIVSTTESTQDYDNSAQIDAFTENNLDNDNNMLFERNFIENEAVTETAIVNKSDKPLNDFDYDLIDGVDFNLHILRTFKLNDFNSTGSIKSTTELENTFLTKLVEYSNSNTFFEDEISTTENLLEQNSKKDKLTETTTVLYNIINRNETEFNETKIEYPNEIEFKEIFREFTDIINQTDATTESIFDSTNDFDTFTETKSISTLETFTTESQIINIKLNSEVDSQETKKYYASLDKTLTSNTEKYADYTTTETSKISTIKEENESSIEDNTEIVNSEDDMMYFDNAIAALMNKRRKSTEDDTLVVNSQETTANHTISDETTVSTASPKAESKTSSEDSIEIVNNEEDMMYFDNTIAILMNKRRKLTKDKTNSQETTNHANSRIDNSQETTNYAIFDETTALTASLKAESKSSVEDSTAVLAKEDKVVVYVL